MVSLQAEEASSCRNFPVLGDLNGFEASTSVKHSKSRGLCLSELILANVLETGLLEDIN